MQNRLSNLYSFLLKYKLPLVIISLIILKIIFYPGMAEGDDLYYTRYAADLANGKFKAFFLFQARWMVWVPTALLYWLIGINTVTTAVIPILYTSVSLILAYCIVLKATNSKAIALNSVVLYGTLPLVLTYGNFLQVAPALEMLTLATVYLAQRAVHSGKYRYYLWCGLSLGLIVYTRITGMFIAVPVTAYVIYKKGFSSNTLLKLSLTAVVATIPFWIQGLVYYIIQNDFWRRLQLSKGLLHLQKAAPGMGSKEIFYYFRTLFIKEGFANWHCFSITGYLLVPAVAVVIYNRFIRHKHTGAMLFLGWLVIYILLMSFVPTALDPYTVLARNIRYTIIFTLPMSALIVSAFKTVLTWIRLNRYLWLFILLIAVINLAFEIPLYQYRSDYADRQKYAVTRILQEYPDSRIYT
ncbi:MAG TPA: glycosyltransferase family 39 protein, partial [Spirochaetota bacterium]|nr:glycosyltransferase family 39 protein [Spirochaetota bacterium]